MLFKKIVKVCPTRESEFVDNLGYCFVCIGEKVCGFFYGEEFSVFKKAHSHRLFDDLIQVAVTVVKRFRDFLPADLAAVRFQKSLDLYKQSFLFAVVYGYPARSIE